MKFKGSIEIDRSREKVVEVFADPTYLKDWQEGFVKKELLSGLEAQDGAVSMMYYQSGKHDMELTETVIRNRLPDSYEAFYHHKHMDNTMLCKFIAVDGNKTRYETYVEYTRINWVMPKLMAILFPGVYRKQAQKWMDNFKQLVEKLP